MPAASAPTIDSTRALLQKNAGLARRFAELGARGAVIATALAKAGTPPADDFVRALETACREFAALRAETLTAAGALGVATPAPESLGSTTELERVLQAVLTGVETAERKAALTRARAEAVAVLDRVAALAHRDDPAFAPLAACQAEAGRLRATFVASTGAPELERLAMGEATAPYVSLLALIDGGKSVSDEQWAALEDGVVATFGRQLAAAASRGRLRKR